MLGFTAALGAELASGRDVAQQLAGGMPILVSWVAMLFIGGSLAPILKGTKPSQAKPFLFFTPEREMINGGWQFFARPAWPACPAPARPSQPYGLPACLSCGAGGVLPVLETQGGLALFFLPATP